MKTLTDPGAKQKVIGTTFIGFLALAGVVHATPESEELMVLVDEFTCAVEGAGVQVQDSFGTIQSAYRLRDWPRLQALVDELAYRAACALATAAAQADASGDAITGARVRKQMQMIKQAAQIVRNQILETRSDD